MPLTAQSLNFFNNQSLPLAQAGVNLMPQFSAPYKEGVSYTKRVPNCQKCGQHNRKSRLKGHKRVCPFKDCNCAKCQVVTERQKLMADQIKIRRRQRKDTIMTLTRDNLKVLNSITAAAVSNPQPYINNLNNLNMLCKQISTQQPSLDTQDLENQQPMQFNSNSNMIPSTSFHQMSQSNSSAFSPASKADSPQLVSSPLSTIGNEMSLSPQQFPRANSFDLGLLSNQNSLSQQQQLLSTLTANQQLQDLKQISPNSNSNGFELTPPQSAGLAAPIPVNPIQQTGNQLSYDNLLALSQFLAPQQQMVSTPSLLQFINPQQPTLNLQDLLSVATLLQQFQGQQLSPPPTEKPHKPNGFVDVCSV